ncbi:hypothetical protein [Sphingomonas xinjiangensis]|uniref:Uncharacterized protein n=1 Tax=Sphingomonas xinjiangensis TaxID=643568 RepID=A0A840YB88_9SPHN|nr:hypothetical protein [Sphingomonas xinjiangensis]MBB5709299.1 hypothetical protein [Sphingomonas xinjiangensis]
MNPVHILFAVALVTAIYAMVSEIRAANTRLATTGSSPSAPRAEAHFNEEIGRG